MVYETAQEFGINSILITSGIEAVKSAIDEAIRLCNALSNNKDLKSEAVECTYYEKREKVILMIL